MSKSNKWRGLGRIMSYLGRHRGRLAVGFVCILLTNLFVLTMPTVIGYAVDRLKDSDVTRQKLAVYAALIIGLAILPPIMRWLNRRRGRPGIEHLLLPFTLGFFLDFTLKTIVNPFFK